jgi:hypothetical protein
LSDHIQHAGSLQHSGQEATAPNMRARHVPCNPQSDRGTGPNFHDEILFLCVLDGSSVKFPRIP